MVGIIVPVCNYKMVLEMNAHHVAGSFHSFGKPVIVGTWAQTARRAGHRQLSR